MANTKVSSVYGVNENGEVVATGGTGSTTVKGFIPSNDVPVDANGKMAIAGPWAQIVTSDSSTPAVLVGADGKRYKAQTAMGLRLGAAKQIVYFNDASKFTLTTSVGATKADDYTPVLGSGAVLFSSPNTGTSSLDFTFTVPRDMSAEDYFTLVYQTPDHTLFTYMAVNFTSDAAAGTFTNNLQRSLYTDATIAQRELGVNSVSWRLSDMTSSGSPDLTNIRKIRITVGVTGAGAAVKFDSLWTGTKARTKVSFMVDDGYVEAYSLAYPYLQLKGVRGSIALMYSELGKGSNLTYAQTDEMYRAGWDVLPHGVGFGRAETNLIAGTWASPDEAVANAVLNRDGILRAGWRGAEDLYAWPEGKYTETLVEKMRLAGFKAARTVAPVPGQAYFTPEAYMLKFPGIDMAGKTFATHKASIDRARATGGSIVFFGHKFQTADGGTGLYTSMSVLQQIVEYLQACGDVDIVPFSELVATARNAAIR